ncbi:MAG: flagellar basal-body MS-ring/collar protein FliF [Bradymonadia bacterium]
MNTLLSRIKQQLAKLNQRLTGPQKTAIGMMFFLLLLMVGFLAYDAYDADYKALPAEYAAEQLGGIESFLQDKGIDYQMSTDGTIKVPAHMRDTVVAGLASEGIIGRISYDINQMSTSLSAKAQAEFLRRHREEVLGHTIAAFEPVRKARVSLALPKESVFLKETRPPSASVMVTLKSNQSLSQAQVKGITRLVSGAVPNLNPDNVVVIDQHSNILTETTDNVFGVGGDIQSFRAKEEARLIQAISRQLERIVGPGNYEVAVQAEMDTRTLEIEHKDVDPKRVVSVNEQSVVETQSNKAPNVGGNAGAAANAGANGVVRTGSASDRNREATSTVSEPSRKTTRTKRTQPELNRLSVSVLVNGRYEVPKLKPGEKEPKVDDDGNPIKAYTPLTQAELDNIRKVVIAAASIDLKRGDRLELVNSKFTEPAMASEDEPLDVISRERLMDNAFKYGVIGAISLMLILFVFRPGVKWLVAPPEDVEILAEGALPAPDEDEAALPGNEEVTKYIAEGTPLEQVRQIAVEDPEAAAAVLRAWLRTASGKMV